jgi:hypothetical protein
MATIPANRIDTQAHLALAMRAAATAEHVLALFEARHPRDERPRRAIEAARAWARGELAVTGARSAAFAAHAAAREATDAAARFAARAAGHAAATAHVAGHARHADAYAAKANIVAHPPHHTMNLTRCPSQSAPRRAAFTLVECLVVLVILFVLVAVLLPSFDVGHSSPGGGQMQQGVQLYKAIFASVLEDPDSGASQFPTSTDGFATSTHYFIQLVTNGTVKTDFSFFSGPGLEKFRTSDPAQFKSDGNAWSVVLDVKEGIASYPFLLSRNLLPAATSLPPRTAALTLDMLGEKGKGRKLEFNTSAAAIITKAGTGFVLKKKDITAFAGRMESLNPTDVSHPILRP